MDIPNDELRKFILASFSEEELEAFCYDYFQEVFYDFGQGMSLRRKVQVLLAYVDVRREREKLLVDLGKARPDSFVAKFGRLLDAPPTPASATTRLTRRVFISYAHAETRAARLLADALRAAGRSVFFAPDDILPGERRVEGIVRGIDISGIFAILVSPAAVESDWVQYEMSLAINLERRQRMEIVPLEVAPADVPTAWRAYPFISFDDVRTDLPGILKRLASRRGPDPSRVPLPPLATPQPPTHISQQRLREEVVAPPSGVSRRVHPTTDITLIHVPAGPFLYGPDRQPRNLSDYWLARYPVTNAQYRRFLLANPAYPVPHELADWARPFNWNPDTRDFPRGQDNYPVVLVRWSDARAFCQWAGLRLPSEEEWEKAARGDDGRRFPWGDEPPTPDLCNFDRAHAGPTPTGRFSPAGDGPLGHGDLAGNVAEWTAGRGGATNTCIIRGGAWSFGADHVAAVARLEAYADRTATYIGFRVAADDPAARAPAVEYHTHGHSGITFARVPGGPFLFGDERRAISLPAFWIGRYEVTNEQFDRFVRITGYVTSAEQKGYGRVLREGVWVRQPGATWQHPTGPDSFIGHKPTHPVVQVSAADAGAFCRWAGLRLPAEEEWEKAARGSDHRPFPWGHDEPTTDRLNFGLRHADTTPVGLFSPRGDSFYGCSDMAGNVWEWTTTPYPPRPELLVVKGGSWADAETTWLRGAAGPTHAQGSIGFRVVVDEL